MDFWSDTDHHCFTCTDEIRKRSPGRNLGANKNCRDRPEI